MGKIENRILPPLVNGKLSGVLEFGVDCVEITEKIFKDENCNFLVQIIWWGETNSLTLRPKKSKFITNDEKQVINDDQDESTVKYEVRTKIKLFQSYLTKCNELELTILDSIKNEVIGSTFLKNLNYLVYNADSFSNIIINDAGEEIGKITGYLRFSETPSSKSTDNVCQTKINADQPDKWNNNDFHINLNLTELQLSKDDPIYLCESGRTNKENTSRRSVNIHYNSPMGREPNLTFDEQQTERFSNWDENSFVPARAKNLESSQTKIAASKEGNVKRVIPENCVEIVERDKPKKSIKSATSKKPEVSTKKKELVNPRPWNASLRQPPKVINKKECVNKPRTITVNAIPKTRPVTSEKIVRGVKKDRARSAEAVNARNSATVPKSNKTSNPVSGITVKPIGNVKTFAKVSNEISKLNKLYLRTDPQDKSSEPVKDNANDNVGKDVISTDKSQIPDVLITEESQAAGDAAKDITDKISVNNKLIYDLSDPVEKLYYETFFQETETHSGNNEFEIAELLNQPGNNYIFESNPQREGEKHANENKPEREEDINVKSRSVSPIDVSRSDEEAGSRGDAGGNCKTRRIDTGERGRVMDCHRCKYRKKLSELDKIIAALKNFETKLRTEARDQTTEVVHRCAPGDEIPDSGDAAINANESDQSKDDSDFLEFRHYLSKR